MAHGADVTLARAVFLRALCVDADQSQGGLAERDSRSLRGALAVGARMLPTDGGRSGSKDDDDAMHLYEFELSFREDKRCRCILFLS